MAPTPQKTKAEKEKSESGLQSPARKALLSPKGSSKKVGRPKEEAKATPKEEDQEQGEEIMSAVKEAVQKRGEGLALLQARLDAFPKGVNGVDRDDMTAACWGE